MAEDGYTTSDGWFLPPEARAEWPGEDVAADTILDAISDVFYMVDRRGRFVEWNDRFRETTGYTDAEIAELHQFDIIPEAAEARARERLAAVAEGGSVSLEAPLVTAEGVHVPHEFTASPLTDDDGAVWGMAGTARDISTQRERENLLRNLHEASRELLAAETEQEIADAAARIAYDRFDCATVGVRLLDGDQLVMVAAESDDERLAGRLPPVAVGEGFVGETYEWGDAVIYDSLAEVDPGVHHPARSKLLVPIQGHGMIALAATEPDAFDEEDLELARVFASDVEAALERTDRERRLRERKRELEQYETLVETMSDGAYMTDADNRVTMVNDALSDLLGLDRAALLGQPINQFGQTTGEEKAAARRELLDGDGSVGRLADVIERPDGSRIHVENRFSLLSGSGFQGTVGVLRDVTEQREREQLLRDLHEMSRSLLTAETPTEVAERATQAAELLGFGSTAIRLLDDDDRLTVVARETDEERFDHIEMPDYEIGEGLVGGAYADGEPVVYSDAADDIDYDVGPLGSVMFLPIPGHGMISIASVDTDAFDETDLELGRVFASDVEAALERADRERRLRERKRDLEGYETLVETMSDGAYMTDTDRRLTMVNEALAAMLGYDREELLGAEVTVAAGDEETATEAMALRKRLREGDASTVTHDADIETADGRAVPVENRMSAHGGEEFRGTVGVVRDVTERRRREQQLKQNHDELARLNRINELIQETIHALASAATREEIEATVCDRLADSEFYRLALTGDLRRSDGVVAVNEWSGGGSDYLDAFSMTRNDDDSWYGPGGRAVQTGEVQVCQDVTTDPELEPWRSAALENDLRSVTAVPLRHGETVHGILFVYADHTDAFGRRELRAFEVLGDMIGFAISATQNRRLVQADDLVEFEFRLPEAGTITAGLTESLDCRYRLLGLASTAKPGLLHYTATEGATPDEIQETMADATEADRVADVRVVSAAEDGCVLEARIEGSVCEVLQESGVQTIGAVASDGAIEFVARGPRDLDFGTLLDTLESTHGDVELLAKREVGAEVGADTASPDSITERLTDRQAAALNAAYFSGYFDWPRDSTAEDVAEALGISSATLHQHLRHAQRKLTETCFLDGADREA